MGAIRSWWFLQKERREWTAPVALFLKSNKTDSLPWIFSKEPQQRKSKFPTLAWRLENQRQRRQWQKLSLVTFSYITYFLISLVTYSHMFLILLCHLFSYATYSILSLITYTLMSLVTYSIMSLDTYCIFHMVSYSLISLVTYSCKSLIFFCHLIIYFLISFGW